MKNKKASLTIIFFTVFIDLMGFGILIPILPTFASKELNITDFEIGFIIAIFSLVQFLFNPVLGKISDRIGRRPIIIVTLLITSLSYIIFSIADSLLILLLSRMLAGFGGSNIGVAQAYIADITDKSSRSKGMGMIGAAFGLGFVFGPLIGGMISEYGYAFAGYGSAAFSLTAAVFAFFLLPESLKKREEKKKIDFRLFDSEFSLKILRNPNVGIFIIIFFIIVFSVANIYGTFAILGYKVYGFTDRQNGYLFGIMGIVSAIIQGGLIRILSKKFSDYSLILIGTIFMTLGLGLLPYGINFTGVAIIISILSVGTGVLQPTILSVVSKKSPDEHQGAILGLNQSLASLARVLGPIWGGFAFEFIGYEFPFLTGASFTFITFIMIIFFFKSKLRQV
ncbi:MAG: MFS transporter [Bacteroidetes bacterium]|nr:MFS transporter [Bacteroidota bacterium]MBU2506192.1 MFS transporter [Bacteroidota bacterium]